MTKAEAHAFLNAVKSGYQASEREITQALMTTGDLDPVESRSTPLVQFAPEMTEAV